jgi:hypothetical protein
MQLRLLSDRSALRGLMRDGATIPVKRFRDEAEPQL